MKKVSLCRGVVINAPEFFADPDFRAWLNNGGAKFTWHKIGEPVSEYSDVIVLIDPGLTGEGSDSDMPEHIWDEIIQICRKTLGESKSGEDHYTVRLTNLD